MNSYDKKYYIVGPDYDSNPLLVKPLKKTLERDYDISIIPEGGAALFFEQSDFEGYGWNPSDGGLPDVIFDGKNLLVGKKLVDFFRGFSISGLQFYPAVFVDGEGTWHEGLWFLNFYDLLDCWCRNNSTYKKKEGRVLAPIVKKIILDADVLDNLPEESRLAFKLGGSLNEFVFFHEKIAGHFLRERISGVKLHLNSDFVYGDQFLWALK